MTTRLPLLLSVPHAGLHVPPEAKPFCALTTDQIIKDGDEGAAEIYAIREYVEQYVTTDIARAIVDLNRAEDDRRADGIVKTHTCWNEPVYHQPLHQETVEQLLVRYYRPYHQRLRLADGDILLCVDCHTMAAHGPPIGPDTGQPRPRVCLGDANGATLPKGWMEQLADCFRHAFGESVSVNHPFSGGYITRHHGQTRPWVQVEISRADFMPNDEKRTRLLAALTKGVRYLYG